MKISSQELQVKNCKSRIAGQELQVKNCKSRIASQELQVKNCKKNGFRQTVLVTNPKILIFLSPIQKIINSLFFFYPLCSNKKLLFLFCFSCTYFPIASS
jgi:tRNA splicing ligase